MYDLATLCQHAKDIVKAYIQLCEQGHLFALETLHNAMNILSSNRESRIKCWLSHRVASSFERFINGLYDPNISPYLSSPKIRTLCSILDEYMDAEDFRAVIFVQLIETTTMLRDYISRSGLDFIQNPYDLSGQKKMTKNQQTEIVEHFRNGRSNLLVATSVAEEGLDIRACNVVIRYDNMNTVTSLIQSRGRARTNQANFHIICRDHSDDVKIRELLRQEQFMIRASEEIMLGNIKYYNLLELIENDSFSIIIEKESVKLLEESKSVNLFGLTKIEYEIEGFGTTFVARATVEISDKIFQVKGSQRPNKKSAKSSCAYNLLRYLVMKFGLETLFNQFKNRYIHVVYEGVDTNIEAQRINGESIVPTAIEPHLQWLRNKDTANPKGTLNELSQKMKVAKPEFVHRSKGPSHEPTQFVTMRFIGMETSDNARSKKEAETRCARLMLQKLLA
eukprot:TRINITY_DN3796_c0_g2_i1.p1 TRINITY_DN3796_c0_g2~~TRINITY_DN3796_c0_g2_i1.p1  ORF type:complete len:450 (-),score=67.72 TRINITY_DN3796_c0_g2_i1:43-1392(-)